MLVLLGYPEEGICGFDLGTDVERYRLRIHVTDTIDILIFHRVFDNELTVQGVRYKLSPTVPAHRDPLKSYDNAERSRLDSKDFDTSDFLLMMGYVHELYKTYLGGNDGHP